MSSVISFQFTLPSDKYKVYHTVYLFLYKSISPYIGEHNENKRSPCFPLNICTLKWYKEVTWRLSLHCTSWKIPMCNSVCKSDRMFTSIHILYIKPSA